jgi:hypothetical protein
MNKKTMKSILLAAAFLLSLQTNAFNSTTIETFFDDIKDSSVQFYKKNETDINEITSKTSELYESGKQKTLNFIDEQEKRYQALKEARKNPKSVMQVPRWNFASNDLDIKLIDNKFHTSEGKVPAGCFFNLAVENNGDDLVHSVYLNRGYLRGCIASNIVYPGMNDNDNFEYSIIKKIGKYEYDIQSCWTYEEPYKDCDKFSIRFRNFDYRLDGVIKQVLGVEKMGNL